MKATKNRRPMTDGARVKRRHIVDVAALLFDEKGYHQVSMEDVANATGLAKPSLYHYFRGKAQILFEIHREFILPLLERENERASLGLSATAELRAIVVDVLKLFGDKPGHMRVFFEHLRELAPEDRAQALMHREEYRSRIEAAIARGVAAGEFSVEDPRIAALAFLGAVNWAYQWLHADAPLTVEDVADRLWGVLLWGFAPRDPA